MQKILPAVCSFFVIGLGQIIKGGKENSRKGLLLILTCYFALPLGLYFILMLMPGIVFLFSLAIGSSVVIGLWLYGMADATHPLSPSLINRGGKEALVKR